MSDRIIAIGYVQHLNSTGVQAEIEAADAEQREISDAAALTIASWWQGPRGTGLTFAALQSGLPVTVSAIHDACHEVYGTAGPFDRKCLDFLCTWACNHA